MILGEKTRKCMGSSSTFSFCEELGPKQNYTHFIWGPYKARGQNGVSGSYMHAVFELKEHEASEFRTSLPHTFTDEGLLQLPG